MKLEKQNMSLRHRIFLLLLAVGLASFIIAGAVSLAGMYAIRENIDKTRLPLRKILPKCRLRDGCPPMRLPRRS